VPGHENRHLCHDLIREAVGRGEVRKVFQRFHDETGFVDLGATIRAITNVGLQGVCPEAHLVIVEEEIDLVWK